MIHARGLARSFQARKGREKVEVKAVVGVDLDVERGEIVGFLGPNGAGKTTTLRMLTTLLSPTAGTATVAGFDVATQSADVRRNIGYVSQSGSTSPEALAGEEVVDHGRLYGIPKAQAEKRGRELFDQLDLNGLWTRKPGAMSGGQRRRLDIAMGLVHDPTLVFLDEPTTGLDPQARANLWTHISALRTDRDATVFLTTHYLDEADALCDRILVIDHGAIVASDTPEALKRQIAGDLIELTVADGAQIAAAATALAALVPGSTADIAELTVSLRVPRAGTELAGLLRELDRQKVSLDSIEVRRPTLDDVFLTVTGRSLREEA
jgi:ABC-2 type transport system ATP-binding protein